MRHDKHHLVVVISITCVLVLGIGYMDWPCSDTAITTMAGLVCSMGLLLMVLMRRNDRQVQALRSREKALRDSEERYRRLVELSPVAIMVHDGCHFLYVNPAGVTLLGAEQPEDFVGRTIWEVVHPDDMEGAKARIHTVARARQQINQTEIQLVRLDGHLIIVDMVAIPVTYNGKLAAQAMLRDITARKQMEKALQESSARLRAILATAVDGIIVTNGHGIVESFNPAAERIFGYTAAEVVGQNVTMLMPSPQRQEHDSYLVRYRTTNEKRIIGIGREVVGQRKDGTTFPMDLAVSEVRLNDQLIFTGIVRDLTEFKQTEAALVKRTQESARSNAELEQFAYVASHDLQEPVRKVVSFTELLARHLTDRLDAEAATYMGYISDGAIRMQELVRDFLAYSCVGRDTATVEPTDVEAILKETLATLGRAIQGQQAEITHDPLPQIMTQPGLMRRLFYDLLSNALKYRGPTPPRVHVTAEPKDDAWLFSVRDNGIGIEAQYAERIFVIFQRLHSRAEYPGTGIGLAICRKIVERQGGVIWVESEVGKGSTFYFTLPAICVPAPARRE